MVHRLFAEKGDAERAEGHEQVASYRCTALSCWAPGACLQGGRRWAIGAGYASTCTLMRMHRVPPAR